ncbi:cell wall hydrolase [Brevundimonas sp.]
MRLFANTFWGALLALCVLAVMSAGPASAQASGGADAQRARLSERLAQMVSDGQNRLPEAAAPSRAQSASAHRPRPSVRRAYRPPRLDLTTPPVIPATDVECLTQAIYYEARNESEEGQAAVAEVVMNRSRALGYPPRVCEVVYQRNSRTCQFTFTCDGSIGRGAINAEAWARAETIAREVYEGRREALLPARSVNYHANYVNPSWAGRLERVRQIGAHIFYGDSITGAPRPGAELAEAPQSGSGGVIFTRNAALDEAYARIMLGGGGSE